MDLMLIILCISIIMILSGAIFKKLQSYSITEPLIALVAGVLIGPEVLKIIESAPPGEELKILKTACEFTIAVALMATALRLPHKLYIKNTPSLSNLVIFGMILMCLSGAMVFHLIFSEFSFAECLLLGAVITPTDPVVASTLTTGKTAKKYLPKFIRNSLSFEAGANDGLAYPIVFLALLLAGFASYDLSEWFTRVLLYENILCGILAFFMGKLTGFILKKAHKASWMSRKTLLSYSLAVTLLLLAGFNHLKMNGIIAVFVGGYAFASYLTKNEDIEEEQIQESMERLATIPVFFILGLMLPWQDWFSMGWKAVAVVIGILFLRRIPALLVLMPFMPRFRKKPNSILIMGWFGPIGVATLFYAILMKEKSGLDEVWILASLMVAASTLVHGLSSVPLEKLYYRRIMRANEYKAQEDFEE